MNVKAIAVRTTLIAMTNHHTSHSRGNPSGMARHPLGGSRTWTRDKCPPHASRAAHGHFTDVAQNVSQEEGPKSWRKSIPMVDVSSNPSCGRALPNALVEPEGLLRPLLRTPPPRRSGPREPGVAAASTARRGRFGRPRRALAPARLPPRPPELRGACGRAACAPRRICAPPPPPERYRGAARALPEFAGDTE
jgi:hypothetical protein